MEVIGGNPELSLRTIDRWCKRAVSKTTLFDTLLLLPQWWWT
jgi:hypothetical protein